jgi:serine/threonine protein kinase
VINILGSPEIASIKNSQYQKLLASIPKQSGKDFGKLFPTASKEAIDLMKRMLDFDIDRRITAEEALKHPYLSILHDP